jgi:ABC-2 type transport system permease protein
LIAETWALTVRELKKWVRTPALVLIGIFQPIIWIALFGSAFNPSNLVPSSFGALQPPPEQLNQIRQSILAQTFGGAPTYITYLTGGMLCVLLLFTSAFSGGSLVWDRRFGFLNKLLASPIPRSSIFFSRVLASVVKGLSQSVLIFFIAVLVPNGLRLSPKFNAFDFIAVFFTLFLLAIGFSSLFTAMAVRVKKWETLIAIVNLLNLPLLFASSALLPISSMPEWLQGIAKVNPISVGADVSRMLIVYGSLNQSQTTDVFFGMSYLLGFAALTTFIGVITSKLALKAE